MREPLLLAFKSLLTLVGAVLFVAGALELSLLVVAPADASPLRGVAVLLAGALLAGWPIATGLRDVLAAARRRRNGA